MKISFRLIEFLKTCLNKFEKIKIDITKSSGFIVLCLAVRLGDVLELIASCLELQPNRITEVED